MQIRVEGRRKRKSARETKYSCACVTMVVVVVGSYLFLFFSSSACFPSCRMVVISPCMKAQGTLEPARGQRSPLGQNTSVLLPCFLMESAEQGKQNL